MKTRPFHKNDWVSVRRIYQDGINTGIATFETEVPDWEIWNHKFLPKCRLVAEAESQIIGWAALTSISKRWVYRGVAEVSIYVDLKSNRRGVGSILMEALIKASEEEQFWTLQSVIFSENEPSILLHKKYGFRIVGIRERIAKRDGEWKNTILMERRSDLID